MLHVLALVVLMSGPTQQLAPVIASFEAENAVVAAMLIDPVATAKGVELLTDRAFHYAENRALFQALARLHERGDALDAVTVSEELKRTSEFDVAGGFDRLAALFDAVPTGANFEYHARIVRERADARRLWRIGCEVQRDATDPEADLGELRTRMLSAIESVTPFASGRPPGRSAAEILADGSEGEVVETIGPPFMYRGRVALVSAREKHGKTSVVAGAVAAVTARQRWLGYPTRGGTVAWWSGATESTPRDVAQLVRQFGGDVARLHLVEETGDPFALLERAARAWSPDVLVVDSLAALVTDLELESGDSQGWTRVMGRLRSLAITYNCAVVVIHHGNKASGEYRDSTAIGASVDVLVALQEGSVDEERKLKAVARWKIPTMTVRLIQPQEGPWRYEPVGSGVSTDALVLMHVEQRPGCSLRSVRDSVPGTNREKDEAVQRLLRAGHIEDRGGDRGRALHVVGEQREMRGVE